MPALLRSVPIRIGLVVIAAALSYAFLDRPVTEATDAWPESVTRVFGALTHLGHSTKYIVAGVVASIVFGLLLRRARARAISLLVLGSIVLPGLLVNLVKISVGRARPHRWLERQEWGFDPFSVQYAYSSFPSGHSSTIFGLATALGLVWPRWRPFWFTVAAIVAFSRVVIGVHFLSDVIVGAGMGALIAWWWSRLLQRWDPHFLPAPPPSPGDARG